MLVTLTTSRARTSGTTAAPGEKSIVYKEKGKSQFGIHHQLPMADLPNLSPLIKADLCRAQNLLPISAENEKSLALYYGFLQQNELELACDALGESAKGRAVSTEFWLALRDAATKMEMWHHATRYEEHAKEP